jgi:hypothetical protein
MVTMDGEQCLFRWVSRSSSRLDTLFRRRLLGSASRSGLGFESSFLFGLIHQRRVHELLLSVKGLICVVNISLLLLFKALDTSG